MVSQDSSKASGLDAVLPVHSEDLSCDFQCDGSRDDLVHLKRLPTSLQSAGEQIWKPVDNWVRSRGSDDPEIGRRHLMNFQTDKENDLLGLTSGQGQRLSLTLGCRIQSDMLNPSSCYKQKEPHLNSMCFNIIGREDPRGLSSEVQTVNGVYVSKPSHSSSSDKPSFTGGFRNSKYLKPAQQLLGEFVRVSEGVEFGSDGLFKGNMSVGMSVRNGASGLQLERYVKFQERNVVCDNQCSSEEKYVVHIRISKLLALLDELESRYEQYCRQIDGVISSFEGIAGIGSANSYTSLTIQAMSRHFSNLRDTIITQIHASRGSVSEDLNRKQGSFSQLNLSDQNTKQNRTLQNLGMIQGQQVWRPLRGLPENSVAVLRAWLFEHFLHPYPNDNEKLMLSSQTGLTRNQISNWFINARVRLWKPMIEEMYREEFAETSGDSNTS